MEPEKQEGNEKKKISRHEFFFELPLYDHVNLQNLEEDFWDFLKGDVDAYNPFGFDTTYSSNLWRLANTNSSYEGCYGVMLTCKRKENTIKFFLYKTDEFVVKVGQFPSLATLQYAKIGKKYDKVLPKQDLHDFKKAIGLSAHGAGAGSLVYLRRIFENIIWETFEGHKENLGISGEDFQKKRK